MQNWSIEHRTSSLNYPQSNGLAESMVNVSKNLIEKAVLQDLPWNQILLDYRCTPISSEIPSPAEILFGRKLRSSISVLPSQVMNDRICKQKELLAKKEGKFYRNSQDFQDRITSLPFEAGQNVWFKNSDSRKCEEAVIPEKCREPNSYMVEIPATGQCFRRNSCCDIGQIDRFSIIELFPLSSCQVIILIARMTFNCSTSCLMS